MQISNNKIFDNELCFTTGTAKMLNQKIKNSEYKKY